MIYLEKGNNWSIRKGKPNLRDRRRERNEKGNCKR